MSKADTVDMVFSLLGGFSETYGIKYCFPIKAFREQVTLIEDVA
ncbi:hypothetical protein [Thermosphaera sp.]